MPTKTKEVDIESNQDVIVPEETRTSKAIDWAKKNMKALLIGGGVITLITIIAVVCALCIPSGKANDKPETESLTITETKAHNFVLRLPNADYKKLTEEEREIVLTKINDLFADIGKIKFTKITEGSINAHGESTLESPKETAQKVKEICENHKGETLGHDDVIMDDDHQILHPMYIKMNEQTDGETELSEAQKNALKAQGYHVIDQEQGIVTLGYEKELDEDIKAALNTLVGGFAKLCTAAGEIIEDVKKEAHNFVLRLENADYTALSEEAREDVLKAFNGLFADIGKIKFTKITEGSINAHGESTLESIAETAQKVKDICESHEGESLGHDVTMEAHQILHPMHIKLTEDGETELSDDQKNDLKANGFHVIDQGQGIVTLGYEKTLDKEVKAELNTLVDAFAKICSAAGELVEDVENDLTKIGGGIRDLTKDPKDNENKVVSQFYVPVETLLDTDKYKPQNNQPALPHDVKVLMEADLKKTPTTKTNEPFLVNGVEQFKYHRHTFEWDDGNPLQITCIEVLDNIYQYNVKHGEDVWYYHNRAVMPNIDDIHNNIYSLLVTKKDPGFGVDYYKKPWYVNHCEDNIKKVFATAIDVKNKEYQATLCITTPGAEDSDKRTQKFMLADNIEIEVEEKKDGKGTFRPVSGAQLKITQNGKEVCLKN